MTTTIQAKTLSLYELEQKFNLTLAAMDQVSVPWNQDQCKLTEPEAQVLAHITANYNNQIRYLPFSEELVKMVVLSPLLDLAGFYGRNFRLVTEEPVEMLLQEKDELIKGRIDVLIVQEQLWILAIESKRVQLDVMAALPQLLFYLLNSPVEQPKPLGLMTNGREFVFAQVLKAEPNPPQYVCSDAFSINRPQEFQSVLKLLKHLTTLLS
jgi:hypothetical protein